MSEGRVNDVYMRLKDMAVTFQVRPGERINEVALSREFQVSRTPLREALNRLVAEHLIEFRPGAGFFCRALDPKTIFELYELRSILEVSAVRIACERGTKERIAALRDQLFESGLKTANRTIAEVTEGDEAFHIEIAGIAGNDELVRQLSQINDRIRFIRWVDMASRVGTTKGEHVRILEALEARDADTAAAVMQSHIEKRMDQIVDAVKEGYSNIYMNGPEDLFGRIVEGGIAL